MIAEKLFLKKLESVRYGRVELITPSGRYVFGDPTSDLAAKWVIENPRFFSRIVFGGNDGGGDSYVDGDWWSPDLVSLIHEQDESGIAAPAYFPVIVLQKLCPRFLTDRLSEKLNLQCVCLASKEFVGVSDKCALGLQATFTEFQYRRLLDI